MVESNFAVHQLLSGIGKQSLLISGEECSERGFSLLWTIKHLGGNAIYCKHKIINTCVNRGKGS